MFISRALRHLCGLTVFQIYDFFMNKLIIKTNVILHFKCIFNKIYNSSTYCTSRTSLYPYIDHNIVDQKNKFFCCSKGHCSNMCAGHRLSVFSQETFNLLSFSRNLPQLLSLCHLLSTHLLKVPQPCNVHTHTHEKDNHRKYQKQLN